MTDRAGSIDRTMHPLFQAGEGGSTPTSALQLRFEGVELRIARHLTRHWHSRFPELGGGNARVCYAAGFGGLWYATAVWTNPTAPKLPQRTWMMLKRFAIANDRPANTASRMMGWMIRDIAKRFPLVQMLVSYSDPETHEGIIYQAAGWKYDGATERSGSMWNNRNREHTTNDHCRRVVRWLYTIWIGPMTKEQTIFVEQQ